MKKRNAFLLFNSIVLCLLFNLSISAQTNYYVSNEGDDNANGLSPETAWKTLEKVKSSSFSPGDSILLESGGVWRESLSINNSGTKGNKIVYSRYGTNGFNPKILGSDRAENWTETTTPNIWQTGTSLTNYSEEYYAGRIFFLNGMDIYWGVYVPYDASFSNLKNEFDYTVNGTTHYVYSTTNPGTAYTSIEVTQRARCIYIPDGHMQSFLEFNGIDLLFPRQAGFDAGYPAYRGATDLSFRNCTVGYVGFKASGYGYGIAAWHSNFLVEGCLITDCGRRGISINLYLERSYPLNRVLNNIVIRKNTFKRGYHTTSLDLSTQMTSEDSIINVYYYSNYVDDSEHTDMQSRWISNQIFTQSGNSHIDKVYIYNNIFVHSTGRNILIEGGNSFYIWNNTIFGHNPRLTYHPYSNVSLNYPKNVDFRNNILYDCLPNNDLQNHGVLMEHPPSIFSAKDYNLYYSLFPKTDRNFSAHRINNAQTGGVNYWNTAEWNEYISENPSFEQNSPTPQDPHFMSDIDDLRLAEGSPAIGAGVKIDMIKFDFLGNAMNDPPDLGAIQFGAEPYTILEEPLSQKLILGPNPANHSISLFLPDNFSCDVFGVRIYSIDGKVVYNLDNYSGKKIHINIPEQLHNGIYIVEAYNSGKSLLAKFIISRN